MVLGLYPEIWTSYAIQRSPYSNLPRFPNGNKKREREREERRKALVLLCGWQVWDWHLWMSDVPSMNPSPDCLFPVSTGMLNTQPMFHAVQLQIQLPRAPWTDFFTLYGTHLKLQLSYHHFQFQWHEQVYVSIQVNLWYLYVGWTKSSLYI